VIGHESAPSRVLAVDPTSRGFGFAVLEGPATLVDWGVHETRRRGEEPILRKVKSLVRHYQPDVIVVEHCGYPGSRRRSRARATVTAILALARALGVPGREISTASVRQLFGRATKDGTARAIAEHLPALASRLPPKRKPWMSEAERMAIFDATAFALTYYFLADTDSRR
jgi:Holliday junction resolvasome RuvABC endonuclease subunit